MIGSVRLPYNAIPVLPMASVSANVRGIRCLLIATSCLALNDACNKYVVATLPVSEIVVLRAIISGGIVCAVIAMHGELRSLRALLRPQIMLRSLAESWIGPFLIIALAFMHQADVTAIYMVAPILVALAGFGHFKERFNWHLLAAAVAGFGGAWLFVNPGSGVFQAVALLPIGASLLQVLREVISRRMGVKAGHGAGVSNRVVLLSTSLFSLLTGGVLAAFFSWTTPVANWSWPDAEAWLLIALASVLFYAGVTYTYEAYRGSDLSVVAPFRYWYLIVAIFTGLIAFGEVPSGRSILGMAIIVGAGAVVLWRQRAP
jgi:drug/metabolite transporter (DMT)-like permease